MALSNQALALISISALMILSSVEAYLAPSPAPAPRSYISSSPALSPSSTELTPHDVKSQLAKYVEGNMQVTMQKIEDFSQALKKRLDDPETSSYTKECIKECNQVYDAAKEDIMNSLTDIVSGDLYKANIDITSASTNVDTCEQCFEEMIGEDPDVKKFDDWVLGVTSDCLRALDTASS